MSRVFLAYFIFFVLCVIIFSAILCHFFVSSEFQFLFLFLSLTLSSSILFCLGLLLPPSYSPCFLCHPSRPFLLLLLSTPQFLFLVIPLLLFRMQSHLLLQLLLLILFLEHLPLLLLDLRLTPLPPWASILINFFLLQHLLPLPLLLLLCLCVPVTLPLQSLLHHDRPRPLHHR